MAKTNKSRRGGLDSTLVIGIGAILALSVIVILIRFLTSNKCAEVKFTIMPEMPTATEQIIFTDVTEGADSWTWDFGDSTAKSTLRNPLHGYDKAGIYHVKLTVNGKCEGYKDIKVEPKAVQAIEVPALPAPLIEGPKTATAGVPVKFTDKTPGSSSWEWQFGESGKVDALTKDASYTFEYPGKKTVTLIVNGKSQQGRWEVTVAPKQGTSSGGGGSINNEQMMALFNQVIAGRIKYSKVFAPYLCDDMTIPVVENGKETEPFSSYFTKLTILDGLKVTGVNITRDGKCIKSIAVTQSVH